MGYYVREGGGGNNEEVMVLGLIAAVMAYEFTPILDPIKEKMGLPATFGIKEMFDSLVGGGGGAAAPPTTTPGAAPTATAPAPAGGGGGGGDYSKEPTCPAGGETCKKDDLGRYDCEAVTATSYEATWCGTFSGDDLTIKAYGPPHHSDGDCCWCVMHVKEDGTMVAGGEGPHPSSNCEHPPGGKAAKAPCYKLVMRPGPVQEGYALVGGQWKLVTTWKGPCGCSKTSTTKTGNQLTFRSDGSFTTKCSTVRPLGGAPAAKAAYAYTGRPFYRENTPISTLHANYGRYARMSR